MKQQDCIRRFLFEGSDVRGEWIRLNSSWQAIKTKHHYPFFVQQQLGKAIIAVTLLSEAVKFKGSIILQIQCNGPVRTLVSQCTNDRKIRGMARYNDQVYPDSENLFGQGRLVLTIEHEGAEPYQGIVEFNEGNLTTAIEAYFSRSEQLETRLWLYADEYQAAGLFLQKIPTETEDEENWNRIETLASTVTENEMMTLSSEDLLYRLFNEEQVRLFKARQVMFECSCSPSKIEHTLLALGRSTLEEIIIEQGNIEVGCEFCNSQYRFDMVDIEKILCHGINNPNPGVQH